ncbi:MAG: AAA family ATPase [bacterium]|nr:AAA family ATPase [bacterium]
MYLKRLELNGFKSFAKNTVFELPSPVTAIVGPNGSGKSNCAEAIRWVLGEQSMKSLRGKKGEDLIFSGSHSIPRMSKASATLVFDNTKNQFPVEFNEVILSRNVYRDGVNEYMINGSIVRLKDIMELLAHVGLGSSQHHIIGQGEADRILYASSKERKEMVEDALGLKIYQIKRAEADRKLERTAENMKQVEALRKEIQPHLKFLKTQAVKFQKTEELRSELEAAYKDYLMREEASLAALEKDIADKKGEPQKELGQIEKKRKDIESAIAKERKSASASDESAFQNITRELVELRDKKSRLSHDLGRLEGMIEAAKSPTQGVSMDEVVPREDVEELFAEVEGILASAIEEDAIDQIQSFIHEALERITSFFSRVDSSDAKERPKKTGMDTQKLLQEKKHVEDGIQEIEKKEGALVRQEKEMGGSLHGYEKKLRELERALYELDGQGNRMKDALRSVSIEEERLRLRREEYVREKQEASHYISVDSLTPASEQLRGQDREKILRDIARLKFKLEDAGGVDETILKELDEVGERDAFFEKELGDLKKASSGLKHLSEELSGKLESEFEKGISKINHEFQKHFETIFGGGKAELKLLKIKVPTELIDSGEGAEQDVSVGEDMLEEDGASGRHAHYMTGLDVYVNLPKKRIRGLDMLSGGERALTSIALLFALSSVNPPPFLVLDEMDAALDENNSRKYGQMLGLLSKGTQLVIITHNRESMRHAGILYGVTMGSEGVSKILSLKLEEAVQYSK